MLDWVEKGIAPEKIIATKWNGPDPAMGVNFTRPLCVVSETRSIPKLVERTLAESGVSFAVSQAATLSRRKYQKGVLVRLPINHLDHGRISKSVFAKSKRVECQYWAVRPNLCPQDDTACGRFKKNK